MVTMKDMVHIRVYKLNVLATTDDFMSVNRKAFKTAVWEALDSTKKSCAMYVPKQPVSRIKSISENMIHIVVVEES